MKIIRNGVFETNSSSTHSITMCMKSDYEKWKNGELYYFEGSKTGFVTKEERDKIIRKNIIYDKLDIDYDKKTITFKDVTVQYKDYEDKYEKMKTFYTKENLEEITQEEIDNYIEEDFDIHEIPCTYKEWQEYNEDMETYEDNFKTPSGEEVVSFGYYGYDG